MWFALVLLMVMVARGSIEEPNRDSRGDVRSWRPLTSTVPRHLTHSPTNAATGNSKDVGMIIFWIIIGIASSGAIFLFWRCRRRAYRGFEKLDPNPPDDSDEELPSMELTISKSISKGATLLDIREEEKKLATLVESGDLNGEELDPLFGRMPESTKPPRILSHSDRILSRNEIVLNSTKLTRLQNHASFDVGDASSSEVSSVSEDSLSDATPSQRKKTS